MSLNKTSEILKLISVFPFCLTTLINYIILLKQMYWYFSLVGKITRKVADKFKNNFLGTI
jgi:hypothetical protein